VKNYIVLLLIFSFACTLAMNVTTLQVLVQNKNGELLKTAGGALRQESTDIGPNTTWYDVQDQLRQKLGAGNLFMSNISKTKVGERGENIFIKREVGNVNASLSKYADNLQVFFELGQ
jgi:hypothetical protein